MRVIKYTMSDTEELELTEEEFKREVKKFINYLDKLIDFDDAHAVLRYRLSDDGVRAWFEDPETGEIIETIGGVVIDYGEE